MGRCRASFQRPGPRLVAQRRELLGDATHGRVGRTVIHAHGAPLEIHLGARRPGIESPELLQQPDAGRAMDRGDRERGHGDPPVVELDEPVRNAGIIERRKPIRIHAAAVLLGHARRCLGRVVAVQIASLEQSEDRLAPLAAEDALRRGNRAGIARQTTMGAVHNCFRHVRGCDRGRGDRSRQSV